MPSWRAHISINLIIFFFWLKLLFYLRPEVNIIYPVIILPFVIIASVFPDIDTNKSRIREWFALLLAVILTILYLSKLILENWFNVVVFFFASYFIIKFLPTPHRGITHTPGFSLLFSVPIFFMMYLFIKTDFIISFLVFSIIFISYNSHLFLDKTFKSENYRY